MNSNKLGDRAMDPSAIRGRITEKISGEGGSPGPSTYFSAATEDSFSAWAIMK